MNIAAQLSPEQVAQYLRTLPSIRERASRVYQLATEHKLDYFTYDPDNESAVADFCISIIKRDYGADLSSIHPHGRWRHLDTQIDRMNTLFTKWAPDADTKEIARRTIDLFLVSVLLDAGAGSVWTYTEASTGLKFTRSEGLGVASYHMFEQGLFSSDPSQPYRVDAQGLSQLNVDKIASAMQVTESNPMVGLQGRSSLLLSLADALKASPQYFGPDARPGNIIDFLEAESKLDSEDRVIPIAALWQALLDGLNPIWPSRLSLGGVPLGDVWPCPSLEKAPASSMQGDNLVPFHKLTMWLTYSLVEVLERVLRWRIVGLEDMTGLPEYRNGGLFVDFGVLTLKSGILPLSESSSLPYAPPSHPAIVEWRAMTVILLDRMADLIRSRLALSPSQLTLAQVLEGATWKGGREIAKIKRPSTGGPPIEIESDGTVF